MFTKFVTAKITKINTHWFLVNYVSAERQQCMNRPLQCIVIGRHLDSNQGTSELKTGTSNTELPNCMAHPWKNTRLFRENLTDEQKEKTKTF